MKQSLYRGLFACALFVALASSCQDEDFGYTVQDVKESVYARNFEKVFGKSDPNQDWSMATLVKANVNLPGLTGTAKMNIMTGDPHNASTRLLGQIWLQDGLATSTFDAIEGQNSVFVTIEQDNEYKLYGQYSIVNGQLNIGNVMMPATRATGSSFSADCPTTLRTTGNYLVDAEYATYPVFDHEAIKYGNDTHTYDEWVALVQNSVDEQNDTQSWPFTDESVRHFVAVTGIDWTQEPTLKDGAVINTKELICFDPWGNGMIAKSRDEWESFATDRGGNLQNNHADFPYEPNSIMVFDGYIFDHFDWSNPVEKTGVFHVAIGEAISYNNQTKKIADWKLEAEANVYLAAINAQQYNGPWVNGSFTFFEEDVTVDASNKIYRGQFPVEHWVRKTDAKDVNITRDEHVKIQYLDNVETIPADPWNVSLGNSLFGVNAFFEERIAYDDSKKVGKYYTEEELAVMEEGYMVHTTGEGTIDLPFIFGCTDYSDQFGYVYWKDGEEDDPDFDIRKLKHYILIEDGRPGSNITCDNGTVDGKTFSSGKWESLSWTNNNYTGTTYRVMFFGENRDWTTGSYSFPAGYNVVFFISCLAQYDDSSLLFDRHNPHGTNKSFNYSITKYNQLLGHLYDGKDPAKTGSGQVKCLAWTRDGNTYMGFGDNCGDRDLNDMVFLIHGNFDKPKTKVAPVKWHLNYDGQHHDGENGTVKDDDLFTQYSLKVGQSYIQPQQNSTNWEPTRTGYTFLGWSLDPTAKTGDKEISGTAVEEGTCYFAIWKLDGDPTPTPDPEWQSWIFACEDLGGSFDYDFNDLVFAVKKTAIENSTYVNLELIPLAAGGTLSAHVYYGSTNDKGEIHKLLTGTDDYTTQILSATPGTPVTLAESVKSSISINTVADNISIHVAQKDGNKSSTYTISHEDHNESYKTPEILILPEGWDWPNEGVIITDVYSGFARWNNDINDYAWIDPKNEGVLEGEHYIVNPLKGDGGGGTGSGEGQGGGETTSLTATLGTPVQIQTFNNGQWDLNDPYACPLNISSDITEMPEGSYSVSITGNFTNGGVVNNNTHSVISGFWNGATVDYSVIQSLLSGDLYVTNIYGATQDNASTYSETTITFTKQ